MPSWIVLVDCRASGHIWKSRQYKGNALESAVHVTATKSPRGGTALSSFEKSLCCQRSFRLQYPRWAFFANIVFFDFPLVFSRWKCFIIDSRIVTGTFSVAVVHKLIECTLCFTWLAVSSGQVCISVHVTLFVEIPLAASSARCTRTVRNMQHIY